MAQKQEGNLVKLAIPMIAMTSDYCFTDVNAMTREERENAYGIRKTWMCIADDFEAQRHDPLLFPGTYVNRLLL